MRIALIVIQLLIRRGAGRRESAERAMRSIGNRLLCFPNNETPVDPSLWQGTEHAAIPFWPRKSYGIPFSTKGFGRCGKVSVLALDAIPD
jgi:hypothetical protein